MIDRTREGNDQGGTCHTDGVDDEVVTVALLDPSARYLFFYISILLSWSNLHSVAVPAHRTMPGPT